VRPKRRLQNPPRARRPSGSDSGSGVRSFTRPTPSGFVRVGKLPKSEERADGRDASLDDLGRSEPIADIESSSVGSRPEMGASVRALADAGPKDELTSTRIDPAVEKSGGP